MNSYDISNSVFDIDLIKDVLA